MARIVDNNNNNNRNNNKNKTDRFEREQAEA